MIFTQCCKTKKADLSIKYDGWHVAALPWLSVTFRHQMNILSIASGTAHGLAATLTAEAPNLKMPDSGVKVSSSDN